MKELLTEFFANILGEVGERKFKARSKESGRIVPFKSQDALDAAVKAGTHEPVDKTPTPKQPSSAKTKAPAKKPAAKKAAAQKPAEPEKAKPNPEDENPEGTYDKNDERQRSVVEARNPRQLMSALDALGEEERDLMYDKIQAGAGGPVASTGETMCTEAQTDVIQGRYSSKKARQTPEFKKARADIDKVMSDPKMKRQQTALVKEMDNICAKMGFYNPDGSPDYERAKDLMAEAHVYVQEKDAEFKKTKVARTKFKTEEDRKSWLKASFYAALSLQNNGPADWDRAKGNGRVIKANARTDGAVKRTLQMQLVEAKKKGDAKAIEHYQRELESWDKFKGYHDTYMVYMNTDGYVSVYHISNKKSDFLDDPQNNTTPEKRLQTFGEAAREANLSEKQAKIVGRAQDKAMAGAKNIDDVATGAYTELQPKSVDLMAKLAGRLPGRKQTEVSDKYINALANDRLVKKELARLGIKKPKPSDILKIAIDIVKKQGGNLAGLSGHFSKLILKYGQLMQSVQEKANAGKSPEEISKTFGGIYTPAEIKAMLADPTMKMLAEVKAQHAAGLEGVHKGFVEALHKADGTKPGHSGDNGPAVETYVRGTMKALHLDTYITNYDGKVQVEMGGVGVTPEDVRGCMASLSGFKGDYSTPEGRKKLIEHLAKKIKLDSNSDAVYLVGEDGKTRTYLATDTWRQAGSSKKIATGFGTHLRKCLKDSVGKRLASKGQ